MKWFFLFLGLFFLTGLFAQETISLDWDIDSLFDEELWESEEEETAPKTDEGTVIQMLNRPRVTFGASYGFSAGIYPGWKYLPWTSTAGEDENINDKNSFAWTPIVSINTYFGLDAQISRVFGVKTSFYFSIPDVSYFRFLLGDFFFDYNFLDTVFFRGGKYGMKWGISPNYGFTNLLARVSPYVPAYESFIFKADIPVGIGGLQLLTLTRSDLMGGARITKRNIGVGGKFNLALRKFDLDTGALFYYGMPFRVFLSVKTTLFNTELYSEGLVAFDTMKFYIEGVATDQPSGISGAYNFGFARNFLDKKLSVNGEFFYNTEGNALFYVPRTDFEDSKITPFIKGLNIALSAFYRLEGKGNPRFFIQTAYAVREKSAQVTPGVSINPWSHIGISFALPITLGSKEGYYYLNPTIYDRDNNPRRFAAVLLLTLSGSLGYTHYF